MTIRLGDRVTCEYIQPLPTVTCSNMRTAMQLIKYINKQERAERNTVLKELNCPTLSLNLTKVG